MLNLCGKLTALFYNYSKIFYSSLIYLKKKGKREKGKRNSKNKGNKLASHLLFLFATMSFFCYSIIFTFINIMVFKTSSNIGFMCSIYIFYHLLISPVLIFVTITLCAVAELADIFTFASSVWVSPVLFNRITYLVASMFET